MSHSPCLIDVRSAAATLPARRWADMVEEECALPATIPRTLPVELSALPGGGQVSYQLPAVSETTETWLPATSRVADTAPSSALGFQPFSSVYSEGTNGLFITRTCGKTSEIGGYCTVPHHLSFAMIANAYMILVALIKSFQNHRNL